MFLLLDRLKQMSIRGQQAHEYQHVSQSSAKLPIPCEPGMFLIGDIEKWDMGAQKEPRKFGFYDFVGRMHSKSHGLFACTVSTGTNSRDYLRGQIRLSADHTELLLEINANDFEGIFRSSDADLFADLFDDVEKSVCGSLHRTQSDSALLFLEGYIQRWHVDELPRVTREIRIQEVQMQSDMTVRCGGDLSQALLVEHVVNWGLLSIIGCFSIPFTTCNNGTPFWIQSFGIPVLMWGAHRENCLFEKYFQTNADVVALLTGLNRKEILQGMSRAEQFDILTDTLFLVRAIKCSAKVTPLWQANLAATPLLGSALSAVSGVVGFGGYCTLLYLLTVVGPQAIFGFLDGLKITRTETSFRNDPHGSQGIEDILRVQDLASNACCGLVEKSLVLFAQVVHNVGGPLGERDTGRAFRILVKSVLEQVLQLSTQTMFLAFTAGDDAWADAQVSASISLSLLMLFIKIRQAMEFEYDATLTGLLLQCAYLPFQVMYMCFLVPRAWWQFCCHGRKPIPSGQPASNDAVREHGHKPFAMAWRESAFEAELTDVPYTWLVRGKVVAAILLVNIVLVSVRLVGVYGCKSRIFSVSALRCIQAMSPAGLAANVTTPEPANMTNWTAL